MPPTPATFNMPVEFVTLEHGGQGLVVGLSDEPLITLALYGELTDERKQRIIKRVIDLIHACMPEHTKLEASISALMAEDDTGVAKTSEYEGLPADHRPSVRSLSPGGGSERAGPTSPIGLKEIKIAICDNKSEIGYSCSLFGCSNEAEIAFFDTKGFIVNLCSEHRPSASILIVEKP